MKDSPKQRVFISPTYDDLVEYRARVIKKLSADEFCPVAMETFSASPNEPHKASLDKILQSDLNPVPYSLTKRSCASQPDLLISTGD